MDRSFLLQTKFLVPRQRGELVPRPHLIKRLEAAANHRLTLISAPPGYGKTTLLAQMVMNIERPFAWYQLDAADGDPTIFLSYLIACFRDIQEGQAVALDQPVGSGATSLLENVTTTSAVSPERILTVLINELAAAIGDHDWLIILEDYQLITNPDVHNLVHILLEKGPPGLHLVIATRTDPPLALARLRARGMLAEFRAPDLRFDEGEVAQWLAQAIPGISPDNAQILNEKTEGWAAALQIIFSSLAGKDAESADRFIAELSGTQRHIFQYLAEEVFQQQPVTRQEFLMRTAVLDQLKASICDAIFGTQDAQLMLNRLEQDNLFLIGLDESQEWYRYHHLFREFLLGKLRRETPGTAEKLERLAGSYYEEQDEMEAAFTHFIRGADPAAAASVLTQFAAEYVERRRVAIVQRYLAQLPDEVVRQHPELLLQHGNVLWQMGRVGAALARFEDAQAAFNQMGKNTGMCRVLTQMAELARSLGNYRRSRKLASEALSYISETDHANQAAALMILAKSEGFLTGMDRGRELAEKSVAAARQAGEAISPLARANLLRSLGHICWWHGDPQATLRYCQEGLTAISGERSPTTASIYITMATPYVYRRDLDAAQKYAELALGIAQELQLSALLPRAYSTLGSLLTRRGELEIAEGYLRQAIQLCQGLGLDSYFRVTATTYLAQNLCAQDRIEEARQLLEGVLWERATNPNTYEMVVCRSVLADIALDSGQVDEAQTIFENLVEIAERRQFRIPLAMVYFGLAYVHLRTGRQAEAIDYAVQSVTILEPLGTYQLYLDQGERARLICRALVDAGQATPFVHRVLRRLPGTLPASVVGEGALIRVRCLGSFRVWVGDGEVTQDQWVSAKARDLLAYFVTFRSQRIPLERVIAAIWPEGGESDRAFHSALYRLRQALRKEGEKTKFIMVKGGEYWLDTAAFQIDVDAFEKAMAVARSRQGQESARYYAEAIDLYHEDYLNNLLYYDWVNVERQRLANLYLVALRQLAAYHSSCGDRREAIDLLEQAQQLDPMNEENYRDLMRCYASAGDRAGLVRKYKELQRVLYEELGVLPSVQTQEHYRHLLDQVNST